MALPPAESFRPGAATIRARLVLEVAAALAAGRGQPYREPEISLKASDGGPLLTLSASSTIDGIKRVVSGDIDLAFLNPSSALAVASRGKGSVFSEPQPLRTIAVLPSRDRVCFAVSPETGLKTIEDIAARRYPLRLSLRGLATHWLHFMLEDIFNAAGFSGADLVSWGGELHREGHIPYPGSPRIEALKRGEFDAVFDEGVHAWVNELVPAGLTVLGLGQETLAKLEDMGYRRDVLSRADYPTLPSDVPTLDFSGWPIFVHGDAEDEMVRRVCEGLEARRESIPWDGPGSLPIDRMVADGPDAPLGAPLHPAAEAFWRERGYT